MTPATALAHHGPDGTRYAGYHHHHHSVLLLKGTVTSVDPSGGTLALKVDKASRGGKDFVGDTVTVKVVKGWVADTNNDGQHSLADIQSGDTVLAFTKRRFANADTDTVSAAFVIDKTHPKTTDTASYRSAYQDGARDGRCDHS